MYKDVGNEYQSTFVTFLEKNWENFSIGCPT